MSLVRWIRALLRLAVAATSVAQMLQGDVIYGLFCLAALVTTIALARLADRVDRTTALVTELLVLSLMVCDMMLGNLFGLYVVVPWYDKALHLGSSMLIGVLALLAIYALHLAGGIAFRPALGGVAILLVTLGVGAVWEIGEYGVDRLLGRATQRAPGLAPHDDTMIDLILDAAGGAIAAVCGPAYLHYRRPLADRLHGRRACPSARSFARRTSPRARGWRFAPRSS